MSVMPRRAPHGRRVPAEAMSIDDLVGAA